MQLAKPDYTASIVTVKANETIPAAFLKKLCAENGSALGIAVQMGGKLDVEKWPNLRDEDAETRFAKMSKIDANTKKYNRMFCFHAFPPEFDESECQPWVVIRSSKNEPILAIAIEGDLPGKGTEDGDSEMLGTIQEFLGPKIEALYTVCGNDPKKLMTAVKDQKFGEELLKEVGYRGHFFFLPAEGEVFAIGKEGAVSQNGSFSWGAASFTYGYTEAAIEAATLAKPDVPVKSKSKWEDDEPVAEVKPAAPDAPKEEPKPQIEVLKADPKPATDPVHKAADAVQEGHWENPPENVHGKPLKKWYRDMDSKITGKKGDLRPDWNKRPAVWIPHKKSVKDLKDLGETAIATIQKVEQPQLPVMDGKTQAQAVEYLKKYLDGSSNVVANPLDLQKQESKLAVFSELCRPLDDMERVVAIGLLGFIKTNAEAAWLYMLELRADRIKRKQMTALGDKKLGELTGTQIPDTAPLATPSGTPLPAPDVHAAPKKKEFKYG